MGMQQASITPPIKAMRMSTSVPPGRDPNAEPTLGPRLRRATQRGHVSVGKLGDDAVASAFMGLLRAAVAEAGEQGLRREAIASRLGISPALFENYLLESRSARLPADRLVALLCRRILPDAARLELCSALMALCGYRLVDAEHAALDRQPLGQQVCEIVGAVGRLAMDAKDAVSVESGGGMSMTAAEKDRLVQDIAAAETELAQLRVALDAGAVGA